MCTVSTSEAPTDDTLLLLEEELKSLSSNTTKTDDLPNTEDNVVAVERINRVVRPNSGRRYSGSRNATTKYTGSGGWRTRMRLRQRPGATRKPQKGGRQRGRNRGRKFRGKGRGRMRNQQTGTGSGRKLKSKNPTMAPADREQADAAFNAPPKSGVGGSSSAEDREEMTNKLDPAGGQREPQRQDVPYQRSCDGMRCQRGGYCVVDDRQGAPRARCLCPLGTKGYHCESGP